MDLSHSKDLIANMQRELVSQHTGRMATTLAAPNAKREIVNKHRPTHWINLSRDAGGKQVVGTAGNTYLIVGKIPIGFEFDRAVIDLSDAPFWGLVDFEIEKYKANSGKGSQAQHPGPLSAIDTYLHREDAWGPSGFFDKQVGTADLDCTLTIYCWKTSTDPFHGVTLLGKDHTNYCPLADRVVPPKKGFKLLPQLGPSSTGMITTLMKAMGNRASSVGSLMSGLAGHGHGQQRGG